MAAIQNARNQQVRLDEVIRVEHHEQAREQESLREAHVRAECAVASADNDRQRAHHYMRLYLMECERFAQQQQAQISEVAEHQHFCPTYRGILPYVAWRKRAAEDRYGYACGVTAGARVS